MSHAPPAHTAADAARSVTGKNPSAPSKPRRGIGRLSVRGRLFAMAIGLVVLGAACVVVATTGLIGQKGKVHQSLRVSRG